MRKDRYTKLDMNNNLYVLLEKIIEHDIGGMKIQQKEKIWVKAPCDIDLGSIQKPNKKILDYKYVKEKPSWKQY